MHFMHPRNDVFAIFVFSEHQSFTLIPGPSYFFDEFFFRCWGIEYGVVAPRISALRWSFGFARTQWSCQSKNERLFFRKSKTKYFQRRYISRRRNMSMLKLLLVVATIVAVVVTDDCCCQIATSNFLFKAKQCKVREIEWTK